MIKWIKKYKILFAAICILVVFSLISVPFLIDTLNDTYYTVTFDSQGGNEIQSQSIKSGEKVTEPEPPIKEGYVFSGWYVGDEQWSFVGYVITEDTILTARWKQVQQTDNDNENSPHWVSFVADGIHISDIFTKDNKNVIVPDVPVKQCYVGEWEQFILGNEDITINAVYTVAHISLVHVESSIASQTDCNQIGNIEYWFCSGCNKYFSDDLGYNEILDKSSVIIEAGCNFKNGHCTKCNSSEGLVYILSADKTHYKVSKGTCSTKDVVIAGFYNGLPITTIPRSSFYDSDEIVSITLPNTVTTIEDYAFNHCDGLVEVAMSNKITHIGENAFQHCTSLTNISIPDSVTELGKAAFYQCYKLSCVSIGNNVKTIKENTFSHCTELESITIGNQIVSIGKSAFYMCSNLIEIYFPNSLLSIEQSAFYECKALKTIALGNSINTIGASAFAYCSNLKDFSLPNTINSIGEQAFRGCKTLTNIILPDNITIIPDELFAGCDNLIEVKPPSNVTSIGEYAFYSCEKLSKIDLSNKVNHIGAYAFSFCFALTSINIPNSVLTIDDCAFYYCKSMVDITIPSSVVNMGAKVFEGCKTLTISCDFKEIPSTWNNDWNSSSCPVLLNEEI